VTVCSTVPSGIQDNETLKRAFISPRLGVRIDMDDFGAGLATCGDSRLTRSRSTAHSSMAGRMASARSISLGSWRQDDDRRRDSLTESCLPCVNSATQQFVANPAATASGLLFDNQQGSAVVHVCPSRSHLLW
jgi:hypothetical protein